MQSYKIAFVFDDSLDKTDGVQQYVLTLGKWFSSQGHDVHYITGETKRTDLPKLHSISRNISVRFNGNRMSIPLPVSRRVIRRLLVKEEFDVIHVQMPYSPFLAGRVVKAAGNQTGVVGTFHIAPHSRLVHLANIFLRQLVSRSLVRFDEVISVSRTAQDFAWDTFGVESSVVPNTLFLEPFYSAKPRKEFVKTTNIVFFGRLVERKGCHYFLRAINRLHSAGALSDDCKVIVCGTGPMEAQLKKYVADHKLDSHVIFTGFVAEHEKADYLAASDIVVYPSTGGESFGIVLLEGMAASRGVVLAGNNPGYASVIGERPAALFDPTDEVNFAEKLQKYLEHPEEREAAREWQQQYVRKFDVPNVADEVMVIYDEALHKRRS